ncbi:group I intron-associated PD-(D/E)XK endonuclease [Microbacterium aurum]
MVRARTYSDDALADAVAASTSWRGVLRALGLVATSAGAMRSVRTHADQLGLAYEHFRGGRRWTEAQLRAAVAAACEWGEVAAALGLEGSRAVTTIKGHAARLGLNVRHLTQRAEPGRPHHPDATRLSRAGSLLAAAWYALCGYDVAWPLEPSRYDLVVRRAGIMRRVQVKTTTSRRNGHWQVFLSTTHRERATYDPDDVDEFFIISGDLACYVIPLEAVGGLHAIHLTAYERYRVVGFDQGLGVREMTAWSV